MDLSLGSCGGNAVRACTVHGHDSATLLARTVHPDRTGSRLVPETA
jgi:hypothetical protein